eukprot:scaffold128547_cov19-Tisochrysis_lutea.AAC.1
MLPPCPTISLCSMWCDSCECMCYMDLVMQHTSLQDTYAEVFKFVDPPLHDPCTVAWVAAPHLFKFDSAPGIYDNKDTVGKVSCAVLLPKLLAQPVLCICGTSAGADGQGLWPHAFCCLILCTLTMSSASFMSSWLWAREQSAGSMALVRFLLAS